MRRATCDAYQSHCSVAHYLPQLPVLKSDTKRGLDEIHFTLPYAKSSRFLPRYRYTNHPAKQQDQKSSIRIVSISEERRSYYHPNISDRESSTTFRSASTSQLGGVGVQERREVNRPDSVASRAGQRQSRRRTRRSQPARGSWKHPRRASY